MGIDGQRALAASTQTVFQEMVSHTIMSLIEHVGVNNLDGVVLTGGVAFNVLANQRVHDTLLAVGEASGRELKVFVPPSPNDGGLSIGALWSVTPPVSQQPLQYLGFRLRDEET